MKRLIITAFLLILTGLLPAESGFKFLRTEKSPLMISTAQTSYLFNYSTENTDINPASSFGKDIFSGQVSYRMLDSDTDITGLSASYTEGSAQYGINISYLNIEGLEGRDIPSEEPLYEFGSKNLIASFNYAFKIENGIVFGLTGKYLYEKIEFEDAYGFAGSFGIFRENNFIDGINLGLAVNNIGTMNELNETASELPADAVFGVGYRHEFEFEIGMNIGNSVRYLINDEEIENFTGLELSYLKRFFVRTGYRANNEGMPFSVGLGFCFNHISFDYSFTPFSDDEIDSSHAVSLSYVIQ